jgi:hypothetical protein
VGTVQKNQVANSIGRGRSSLVAVSMGLLAGLGTGHVVTCLVQITAEGFNGVKGSLVTRLIIRGAISEENMRGVRVTSMVEVEGGIAGGGVN